SRSSSLGRISATPGLAPDPDERGNLYGVLMMSSMSASCYGSSRRPVFRRRLRLASRGVIAPPRPLIENHDQPSWRREMIDRQRRLIIWRYAQPVSDPREEIDEDGDACLQRGGDRSARAEARLARAGRDLAPDDRGPLQALPGLREQAERDP